MPTTKNIVLLYKNSTSIPDQVIEMLKARVPCGFALQVCDALTSDQERRSLLQKAEYVIVYSVPLNDFDVMGSVKLVQLLSAGSDLLDLEQFQRLGIPIANNGSVNAWTVAEHAVLLMLSVLRKLPTHHNSMQEGVWLGHKHALSIRELRNKQVGIIGFGNIGQSVARIVSGFQGKVRYYSNVRVSSDVENELDAQWMPLPELLKTSDIITIHTPLVDSTREMLSHDEFGLMKSNAILINTARGAIINETALLNALDNKVIAGAGLDTFVTEPRAEENPFTGRDNVVLTPHIAGTSIDNWDRRIDYCFSNIQSSLHGKPLKSVINR
ncbi:2-hydroxyacid dehydrogenase [Vibrio natriegens]